MSVICWCRMCIGWYIWCVCVSIVVCRCFVNGCWWRLWFIVVRCYNWSWWKNCRCVGGYYGWFVCCIEENIMKLCVVVVWEVGKLLSIE